MEKDSLSFVPTKCSALKNIAVQYKEITFTNPAKKKKTESVNNSLEKDEKPNLNNQVIDMKRARYEVLKFAKSNVKSSNKQKTDRQLALELGAKPLRRKPIPYKELLAKKQKRREKNKRKEDLKKLTQVFNGKSILNNRKKSKPVKKNKSGILDIYGKVTYIIYSF